MWSDNIMIKVLIIPIKVRKIERIENILHKCILLRIAVSTAFRITIDVVLTILYSAKSHNSNNIHSDKCYTSGSY